jgi:signal transduction histidine kinase
MIIPSAYVLRRSRNHRGASMAAGGTLVGTIGGIPQRRRASQGTVLSGALTLGVALWLLFVGASSLSSHTAREQLPALAVNLASGLFLVIGVLRLAFWRLTEAPQAARGAVAFLVLGTGLPAASLVGPLLHEPAVLAGSAPSTRILFLVVVFALLLPGPQWRRATGERPISARYLVVVSAALALVATGLLAGRLWLPTHDAHLAAIAIAVAAMGLWLLLAVRECLLSNRHWITAALCLLAAAELVRGLVAIGARAVVGFAPGLQLAAAAVVVCVATAELRDAHRNQGEHFSEAVAGLQRHLAELEQVQQQRLHDARTAMVGVLGASELLSEPGPDIDADLLRRLIAEELQRLCSVLETRTDEPLEQFDLADALGPVVLIHQLDGRAIRAELSSLPVIGRPLATATVLDNLLRNACLHAPGADVVIRASTDGHVATVVVEDNGPGIPAAERQDVLRFGVRGSSTHAPGDGIGLHAAWQAMAAQGGALRIGERAGGGTRVSFSLPQAVQPVVQRRAS